MRLSKALKDKELDVRLRDKLLAEGKLKSTDVKTYLEGLPDEADNVTYTERNRGGVEAGQEG